MKSHKIWAIALGTVVVVTFIIALNGMSSDIKPVEIKPREENNTVDLKSYLGLSDEAYNSLKGLQADLNSENLLCGAMYLGEVDNQYNGSINNWIAIHSKNNLTKYPFLGELTDKSLYGSGHGELYCIIPARDDTDVSIRYYDKSYFLENKVPFFVFINKKDGISDTSIVFNHNKINLIWKPTLDNDGNIDTDTGRGYRPFCKDLSDKVDISSFK